MNTVGLVRKYRIGVLMGGMNIEREVSFNSGRTICDHIDTSKYEVIPLFQTEQGDLYILGWHFLHRGKISDFRKRLDAESKLFCWDALKNLVDFVYVAMHGRYAEDGTLQGMLEVLGIPYLGTKVLGSALGMDKAMHKQVLKAHGIHVPAGVVVKRHEVASITSDEVIVRLQGEGVTFPCLVKPSHEGSSFGISIVHHADELMPAIAAACGVDEHKTQDVLVEEKVEGMEFVCVSLQKTFVQNGQSHQEWFSLPITEVIPEAESEFYDYEQKYMPGRASKVTPARCSKEDEQKIVKTCEKAATVLHFSTVSRIDGILNKNGEVVIIDPNSLTGMGPATFLFHQAAEFGMSHSHLINFLIESELQKYGVLNLGLKDQHDKGEGAAEVKSQKLRVAVLLGGDSNEREISLESGRNVCYKIPPHKYDVSPLFVNEKMELFKLTQKLLIKNSTREIADLVTPDLQIQWADLASLYDFIFIGLHGGKGENGAVQGTLEMLGLPYNGSGVLASALCMDKYKTNAFLKAKGFDVPLSHLVQRDWWMKLSPIERESFAVEIGEKLSFPLIVKPYDDGCSVFVEKATTSSEVLAYITQLFEVGKNAALLEEFVKGMELTGGVYGNHEARALPPSQAVAQKGILSIQEKFLPGAGENLTPAPLPEAAIYLVQKTLEAAYEAIGCKGYVRIDCFYQQPHESPTGKERIVFLEFNTLPGLTPATCLFHQAAEVGIKPMEFIDIIIELGFENHKRKDAQHEKVLSSEKKSTQVLKKKRVEGNQINQQTLLS